MQPLAHVFGHTHFAWDATLDDSEDKSGGGRGTRYIQAPLCYPLERKLRWVEVLLRTGLVPVVPVHVLVTSLGGAFIFQGYESTRGGVRMTRANPNCVCCSLHNHNHVHVDTHTVQQSVRLKPHEFTPPASFR